LIVVAVAAVIYSLIPNAKIETAYTRVATISCKTVEQLKNCESGISKDVNCSLECKSYKMLDKIIIEKTKSEYFKVFDKNDKYTYIAADDVVFENTSEYEQAKNEKENYQRNSEKIKTELVNKSQKLKKFSYQLT